MRHIPEPGDTYRHFKGGKYVVLNIAQHTETGEKLVVYRHLMGTNHQVYARPFDMFMSRVNSAKYPNAQQKWRFELSGDDCDAKR